MIILDEPTEGIQPSIIKDIAKALNEVVNQKKPIAAAFIRKQWSRWMVLAKCWLIASKPEVPDEFRVVCRATYDNLIWDVFDDINPNDQDQIADIEKYLSILVAAGALTEEQRLATLAFADFQASWASLHGWDGPDGIGQGDVAAARKLNV